MQIRVKQPGTPRRGIAYVATLCIVLITSILGLAFVHTIGTHTAVTADRHEAMQSQYLAESAVHHALWRLQNEPGFPTAEDYYFMHDLAGGRYGYKVRAPTPTTYGTVATVGVMGDHFAQQSYVPCLRPSNVFLLYGRDNDPTPNFRRAFGAGWSSASNAANIAAYPVSWLELEACPVRDELLMGTLDNYDYLELSRWNGSSWVPRVTFTYGGALQDYKCFDIAYESQSGDALVVGRYDSSALVRYNVWNGSSWLFSSSSSAFLRKRNNLTTVVMDSNPLRDEILIGSIGTSSILELHLWDGSSFTDLGVLDWATNTYDHGVAEIVHEQQSGEAMILWVHSGDTTVQYRTWDGSSLSPIDRLPVFGSDIKLIKAAADPTSDHVLVAAVLRNDNLYAAVWNGDAWTDSRLVDSKINYHDRQIFDVAWEGSGDQALLAWGPNSGKNIPLYLTWRKGTALAASPIRSAPSCVGDVQLVRLFALSEGERVRLVTRDNDLELRYSLWTGNRFVGSTALRVGINIRNDKDLPFDMAE